MEPKHDEYPKCPECNSDSVKCGTRRTRAALLQVYQCKNARCARKFAGEALLVNNYAKR